MAIIYEAKIPLNPRTKKNSQKIVVSRNTGKPFIIQNEKYKQYEQDCAVFLRIPDKPIETPVNVKCVFYRESRIRCDLTNLLEAIDDILVSYGVLSDDNFTVIASHDGSRVYIDRDNPRTEITISNFVPDWASEIEKFPIEVTKYHFGCPEEGIEGDIEKYLDKPKF